MPGEESRCPVTGLPVLRRPEWTDVKLDEGYHASFFILGDSILVGRPTGFGTMEGVKKLIRLTEEIQNEIFRPDFRYVRIIDCSNFKGMSLKSRKYFSEEMKKRARTRCIIFCGVSTFFSLGVQLAHRLHKLPYELKIVADYPEAALLARRLATSAPPETKRGEERRAAPPPESHNKSEAGEECRSSSLTESYVEDVLAYLRSLDWAKSGVGPDPEVRPDHPFLPVFRSINLVKRDLDNLFEEHRKTVEDLERTNEGLWSRVAERTAELSAGNAFLRNALSTRDRLINHLSVEVNAALGPAEEITGEASRLNRIFLDLKALSDIEAGRSSMHNEVFDMTSLLRETKIESASKIGSLTDIFSARFSEDLKVKSDAMLVGKALAYLAESTLALRSEGGLSLETEKTDTRAIVRFQVDDSGREKGFPRLFQPFTGRSGPDPSGTGSAEIGLYLAWKTAGLLEGTLNQRGEFGEGVEFIFSLPLEPKQL